ncbi:hypothetical protein C8Q70DRAFT_378169 [Cubamyces menziesii]|uniref:Transmembrane protein n=1 Tax=Trametes cubensis TaxID=1111947 RepID=A0AAD7U335_9APHY|nr:hypothetical protein C8Q70DRAFT_378169 [Cubamyces menziesii]KAJ8496623.1 hypothetical protein ONZ51_g1026 [Trametes cubensis]
MSSSTATVFIHATNAPSVAIPAASATSTSPPIVELARLTGHALSLSFSYTAHGSVTLLRYILLPLPLLSTPLLYLLAPVFVLSQVLLDVFIFTPFTIVSVLVRNIYPVYVFVGAACICAAFVGYLARAITVGLTYAIFAPRSAPPLEEPEPTISREKGTTKNAQKARSRKRVSIKEER